MVFKYALILWNVANVEASRTLASVGALAPTGWGGYEGGAREQCTSSWLLGNLVPVPRQVHECKPSL